MESNPNLGDIDVTKRPKNQTTNGTVLKVQKGTRAEMYNLEDGEEPTYGDREDELLSLTVETTVNGTEFMVYEDIRFYDNPSDRSDLGKYVNRYGVPETGQEVTVDFDSEGNVSVVL